MTPVLCRRSLLIHCWHEQDPDGNFVAICGTTVYRTNASPLRGRGMPFGVLSLHALPCPHCDRQLKDSRDRWWRALSVLRIDDRALSEA